MAGVVMANALAALVSAVCRVLGALWGAVVWLFGAESVKPQGARRPQGPRARHSKAAGETQARGGGKGASHGPKNRSSDPSGESKPKSTKAAAHSKSTTVSGTPPLGGPETAIEAAVSAAATAQAAVARASAQRLTALLEQPARERLQHLRDPALTAADRRRLRDSIGTELPRRAVPKRRSGVGRLRYLRYRWRTIAAIVILAAVCVGFVTVAWRNTGVHLVVSNDTWGVTWRLPGGRAFIGAWRAGYPAVAMKPQGGEITLRYWLNGLGYAETTVPTDWLRFHSRASP